MVKTREHQALSQGLRTNAVWSECGDDAEHVISRLLLISTGTCAASCRTCAAREQREAAPLLSQLWEDFS